MTPSVARENTSLQQPLFSWCTPISRIITFSLECINSIELIRHRELQCIITGWICSDMAALSFVIVIRASWNTEPCIMPMFCVHILNASLLAVTDVAMTETDLIPNNHDHNIAQQSTHVVHSW